MFNKGWGVPNGMLVFLVAVPFTLWLVGQDLGALAGWLGNLVQVLTSAWAQLLGIGAATLGGLLAASMRVASTARTEGELHVPVAEERLRVGAQGGELGEVEVQKTALDNQRNRKSG